MTTSSQAPPSDHFMTIAAERRDDAAHGRFQRIVVTASGPVTTIRINRPEVLNCFDYLTLLELADALHDAGRDPSVHVVVLTGTGERAFCTGADLKEQRHVLIENPQLYHVWMGAFIDVHERLRNIGKPTIARINGMAVGGGNEFNMACDLAVCVDDAYFQQVGTAHGSVPAGGATQWLPLMIGDRRAREMLWLGRRVEAGTAREWGLVNDVVARDELDDAVERMTTTLLGRLPETMRYTRTQTNFWKDLSWYQTIHHARDWLTIHTAAPEVREAVDAFLAKETADYAGIRERFATPAGAYSPPTED